MKCTVCGHEGRAGSTACSRCGAPVSPEAGSLVPDEKTVMRPAHSSPPAIPQPEPVLPPGYPAFAVAPEPPPHVPPARVPPPTAASATGDYGAPQIHPPSPMAPRPAGFAASPLPMAPAGTRFAAHLLDGLVITGGMIVLYVLSLILEFLASAVSRISYELASLASALVALLMLAAYAVVAVGYVIWGWGTGQTVGKRVMKIAVVDTRTGGPIGYSRAIVRYLMMVVMGLPCYAGYFSILASDGRGWHDKAADSRVVVCPDWPTPVLPWKR